MYVEQSESNVKENINVRIIENTGEASPSKMEVLSMVEMGNQRGNNQSNRIFHADPIA